jgi:hypothetical protein
LIEGVFMSIDKRHGGPYDRGSADAYYRRPFKPHYYKGATGSSELVTEDDMTDEEILEYNTGFTEQVESGTFKEWE